MRFLSIVWFLQFLSHFLWVLEARCKLILFYTKFSVNRAKFLASACATAQQTSTLKLPAFLLRFQTEEYVLRVNKSKITGENTFNGNNFEIQGSHGSSKDKKTLCWIFFMIFDNCFNLGTVKYVYIRFSSIVRFLQFLSHFLWVLQARNKFILFYTKF